MSGAAVLVATTVATDPESAFRLFTVEVDRWWRRGPVYRFRPDRDGVMRFDPGPGGRLVETYDDGTEYEVGRIRAWEPGLRLAFSWRNPNYAPDEETEVEVRFAPAPGGTRVTVRHSGLGRLPPGHPARHGLGDVALLRLMGDWWRSQVAGLDGGRPPG